MKKNFGLAEAIEAFLDAEDAKDFDLEKIGEHLQADMPNDPMPGPEDKEARDAWFERYEKVTAEKTSSRKLARLLEAFDVLGIGKRGRVKEVAEKTGYSQGRVSDLLAGKVLLNNRFVSSICAAYGINEEWALDGVEPMLTPKTATPGGDTPEMYDIAIQEAIKEMLRMSESEKWALVAELKKRRE